MKQLLVILLTFLLAALCVRAQDPSYAIVYSHPLILTPSFAGLAEGTFNATLSHRVRTTTPTEKFNTSTLSANLPVKTSFAYGGVGVLLQTDQAGGIRTTQGQFAFAYEAPLGTKVRYHHLRAGFQFGLVQRQLLKGDYRFEDQFDGIGFSRPTGEDLSDLSILYPDISLGLMWYRTQKIKGNPEFNHYLGFSVHHINRPVVEFFDRGKGARLNMRNTFVGGGRLRTRTPFDLNLHLQYQTQNNSDLWSASFFTRFVLYENNVWFGREKAAFILGSTLRNAEVITAFGGFQLQKALTVGFGYDFLITSETLAPNSYGGLQVMVSYLVGGQNYRGSAHPFPSF